MKGFKHQGEQLLASRNVESDEDAIDSSSFDSREDATEYAKAYILFPCALSTTRRATSALPIINETSTAWKSRILAL